LIGRTTVIRNPISANSEFSHTGRHSKEHNKIKLLVIADSAHERRKAFSLACESILAAYQLLKPSGISIHVSFVGQGADGFQSILTSRGIECTNYGKLETKEIASVYKNTDAVFTPSLEDNWPNILVEGLACGTLAICGPGHGCEEFVVRYNSGIVSDAYTPDSFAIAIQKLYASYLHLESSETVNYKQFYSDHNEKSVASHYLSVFSKQPLHSDA
jgi:glycosyltransferase involved in cell wall biosynthesis